MRKKVSIYILIAFLIISIIIPVNSAKVVVDYQEIDFNKKIHYDTFIISSDSDFVTHGFPGEGSEGNPYVIENYNIESENSTSAIFITGTTAHFTIKNCYFEHAAIGIEIRNIAPYSAHITDNICIGSTDMSISILTEDSKGFLIRNNTCSSLGQGIRIIWSNSMTIQENKISNCNQQGINIHHSHSNNITYNEIKNCTDFGIALVGGLSYYNLVHHNTFIENAFGGEYNIDGERFGNMTSQAYDDGTQNIWYEEETKKGNFWSDFSGKGNYSIDGSAESFDLYPKTIDARRTAILFSGCLIALLCLVFNKSYFKKKLFH
jgi:parallel beta-helix repeat protein